MKEQNSSSAFPNTTARFSRIIRVLDTDNAVLNGEYQLSRDVVLNYIFKIYVIALTLSEITRQLRQVRVWMG